jgi:hypothetical protein
LSYTQGVPAVANTDQRFTIANLLSLRHNLVFKTKPLNPLSF